jgi:hypothetical protein
VAAEEGGEEPEQVKDEGEGQGPSRPVGTRHSRRQRTTTDSSPRRFRVERTVT